MENFEFRSTSAAEREPHLPLINRAERMFIENAGGEYSGYIRMDEGKKVYERFRVDRRAHYDETRREVIETYNATEAIDRDGENQLHDPEDTAGFSILISELSRSGEELGKPEILMVRSADFGKRRVSAPELEEMARDVHALATQKALTLDSAALRVAVEDYLQSAGWGR